jgi:hypothetical protein
MGENVPVREEDARQEALDYVSSETGIDIKNLEDHEAYLSDEPHPETTNLVWIIDVETDLAEKVSNKHYEERELSISEREETKSYSTGFTVDICAVDGRVLNITEHDKHR